LWELALQDLPVLWLFTGSLYFLFQYYAITHKLKSGGGCKLLNYEIYGSCSWDNLFSKEFVEKLGAVIVKLHRKRAEYKSQMKKQSVP
jgi:hypothetical protein